MGDIFEHVFVGPAVIWFVHCTCGGVCVLRLPCCNSFVVSQVFMSTKTERLKNQQREYESQMQYRQHLQVRPHTHPTHSSHPSHTSQEFIDRWRYNAKRSSQAQMRIKILEKLPILTPVVGDGEVVLRFPDVDKLSPPILQLTEV